MSTFPDKTIMTTLDMVTLLFLFQVKGPSSSPFRTRGLPSIMALCWQVPVSFVSAHFIFSFLLLSSPLVPLSSSHLRFPTANTVISLNTPFFVDLVDSLQILQLPVTISSGQYRNLKLSMSVRDGDPDLYVGTNYIPTSDNYDFHDSSYGSRFDINILVDISTTFYLLFQAYEAEVMIASALLHYSSSHPSFLISVIWYLYGESSNLSIPIREQQYDHHTCCEYDRYAICCFRRSDSVFWTRECFVGGDTKLEWKIDQFVSSEWNCPNKAGFSEQ
jgi:hypothetical protein